MFSDGTADIRLSVHTADDTTRISLASDGVLESVLDRLIASPDTAVYGADGKEIDLDPEVLRAIRAGLDLAEGLR